MIYRPGVARRERPTRQQLTATRQAWLKEAFLRRHGQQVPAAALRDLIRKTRGGN